MYEQSILELGGDVSTDPKFDNSATHLLCIRLSRNEKMLGSIAAGKWLLHCSYLRDCEHEGRFLDVSIFVRYIICFTEMLSNIFFDQFRIHFFSTNINRRR